MKKKKRIEEGKTKTNKPANKNRRILKSIQMEIKNRRNIKEKQQIPTRMTQNTRRLPVD